MTDVMVLHAELPAILDAARQRSLLERLPYARRLELERRSDTDRAASLRGVELVLVAAARLRGTPARLDSLRYPEGRKPYLEQGPWFSVSHCSGRVAVAVSDRCDVGIDVEDLGGRADAAGLDRWTATEATLKAAGAGLARARDVRLAADLATGEVSGRLVHLRRLQIAPGCVACLGTLGVVTGVRVDEWAERR
jgi:phosphopantetheinyl transferase